MSAAHQPDHRWRRRPAGRHAPWRVWLLAVVLVWPAVAAPPGPAAKPATAAASAVAAQPSGRAGVAQREQQKAAAYARRQQAAKAHRDAVLARIKRQDAERPPARPLPMPWPAVPGAPAASSTRGVPPRP